MKYLTFILAIVFFSCSTDSSQNTETTDSDAQTAVSDENSSAETESSADEAAPVAEPIVIREIVVVNESDIKQNDAVRATFMELVDVVNNATGDNVAMALKYLDKDYVFRGRDREESAKRMEQQFAKYKSEITDLEIKQLTSSCDLAYLIASFKRTMTDRTTGEVRVDARDKVGLFVFRKSSAGEWKLLVQKTDDGFAHWFYMPKENS